MRFIALACFTTFMTASLAAGQSRQVPAPPQAAPLLLSNATIHTVSGDVIPSGWILIDEGRIREIGSIETDPSIDVTRILDLEAMHVYPGLIATDTQLGLIETGAVDVTHDHDEYGSMTPEVRPHIAINPDSDHLPVARANGILTALVFPTGGTIPGRTSVIRLDGWTSEDLTINPEAGLVISWPNTESGSSRNGVSGRIARISRVFDDAEAYFQARASDETVEPDLRYEAMRSVIEGDDPIYVRAASAGVISSAVAWARSRDLDIVIVGGREADIVAELLVQEQVPVIIGGIHELPSARHDPHDRPFTLPARLHEAGVRFCIASGEGSSNERNLPHHVATAVGYGLPPEAGLRSITIDAAEISGIGDTHGSIEPGKQATLIITDGDPLEMRTVVFAALIDGRIIDLTSRHTQLNGKYRQKYRQLRLLPEDETGG